MSRSIPARAASLAAMILAVAAFLALTASSAGATPVTIYSNLPSPTPGEASSFGFYEIKASEFGGEIEAASESLTTTKVTVGMSSRGCQKGSWELHNCETESGAKFELPITLHIYAVGEGGEPGTEVGRLTRTVKAPYRPSESLKCLEAFGGGWGRNCTTSGKLFKAAFTFKGVVLPEPAIVSVSFNTSLYGVEPTGCSSSCPEDSVGVAARLPAAAPSIGTLPSPLDTFLSSVWNLRYCDSGAGGTGTFRRNAGCQENNQPLISVATQ